MASKIKRFREKFSVANTTFKIVELPFREGWIIKDIILMWSYQMTTNGNNMTFYMLNSEESSQPDILHSSVEWYDELNTIVSSTGAIHHSNYKDYRNLNLDVGRNGMWFGIYTSLGAAQNLILWINYKEMK